MHDAAQETWQHRVVLRAAQSDAGEVSHALAGE
jgi:hypothetical protein